MATQILEFNATTGLTITAKLFALKSDTVAGSVTAVERTNDKGRYRATFTDIAAGSYRLNGFVGAVGGFANEVYTLTAESDVFLPESEIYRLTESRAAKIDLIGTGQATVTVPVSETGVISSPIIIGDYYLQSNNRAFVWRVEPIPGFNIAQSTTWFGGNRNGQGAWLKQGTITLSAGKWVLTFEMEPTDFSECTPSSYDWSVSVHSNGVEVTVVRSGDTRVRLVSKYT